MFEEPIYPFGCSFAHGEVSPFLFGRVDLQAYQSGLRTSRNAFIHTEGSWSNRPGWMFQSQSQVTQVPGGSVILPFTFNVGQSYIIEIGAAGLQVYYQGVPVGTTLTTPYLVSELPYLRWSQSADTLTITHQNHPPFEFKRTSATTFTFQAAVYRNGPFAPMNTDGTTLVAASASSGTVTLTSSTPIFQAGHVGGLFYLQQQDVSPITPWQPVQAFPGLYATYPVGYRMSSNNKNYICAAVFGSASQYSTGAIAPNHTYGVVWDGNGGQINGVTYSAGVGWEFTDFGYGVLTITGNLGGSTNVVNGITYYSQCTATVMPVVAGQPAVLPYCVVGGKVSGVIGTWNYTGNGTTTAFGPLTGGTTVDPTKYFVTINGVWQPPASYTIAYQETGIFFLSPPANGSSISVTQVGGLFASTFWAFGAFSPAQGYPASCTYYPDRLVLAGTIQQPTGVFGSKTSDYHNFSISNPVVNSDAFTVFLNARQLNTIVDLVPLQDLIVGTANIIWRLWAGSTNTALGPLAIQALPQAFVGESNQCPAVLYGDSMLYTIYGGRRIRDFMYQFQFDKYTGGELTAYSRHLVPYGTYIKKMAYAPDPWGQLFALRSDGELLCCTYVREQQMIAWNRWDTPGTIDDIAIIPENNFYSLYCLVNRTINGGNVRNLEKLASWETSTIYDYNFMDCSITYDGRNTSTTTMTISGGMTWLSQDVVTLTASGSTGWAGFQSSDPGYQNVIQFFDANNQLCRVLITGVSSTTIATGRLIDPCPSDLQGVATLTWTFARTTFTGATNLAGQTVMALGDSNVIAGRQGAPTLQVSLAGTITLPNAVGVLCVGLQYLSDFETLSLNEQGLQTIRERAKGIPHLYLDVTGSRGLITGTDFNTMTDIKERAFETYTVTTDTQEGIINNLIYSEFDSEAHVCIRQTYPLPCTIRMVIPSVNVGDPVG
jgi:hypothetical protein